MADPHLLRSFVVVARGAAAVAILLGAVVLVAWPPHIDWIKNPLGQVPMAPSAALMFVLSGAALALSIEPSPSRARRWGTQVLALLCGTLAVVTLAEDVFQVDLGMTTLLIRPQHVWRATAIAFTLLASALLMLDTAPQRRPKPAEVLALGALLMGSLATGGYAFGASQFYASPEQHHPVGTAILAALGLVVLAIGVLCARTDRGLMSILVSPLVGGHVVRRVLLILLVIPTIGFFASWAQNAGAFDPPGASVVAALAGCFVAALAALWLGHQLNRTDAQRLRSDEKLRDVREWGEFFEHASFGVWLGSPDARLIQVNDAFARMHGCTREEAEGRPLAEFFPEDRREELAKNIDIVHERGHHRWESENVRKDGTVFPVAIDSGAVFGTGGEVRYRATYIQDITEEKRAEAERTRLAAIVQCSDDAILSKSLDGIVLDWNHGAEHIFGYTAEEMIGQSTDIIVPDDRRAERDALVARARAGEPVIGFETIRVCKDGVRIPVALTMFAISDAAARVTGIAVIERDISVLKQFEREREEWAAIVAHELRQPAATIRLAADSLRDLEGEHKKRLGYIQNASRRLDQMIQDLLDVSRIEAHKLSVRPTRLNAETLVEGVVGGLAPDLAHRCDVRFEVTGVEVLADAGRFSQVLSNLLSNADKYGYPGAPIDVHVERAGAMVKITVTNEGPGIEPDEIPLLFSRFARTRAAQAGSAPGLGLGLYISRGLVEEQGGRLWAESAPGDRTSFHFTLPEAQPAEAHPPLH